MNDIARAAVSFLSELEVVSSTKLPVALSHAASIEACDHMSLFDGGGVRLLHCCGCGKLLATIIGFSPLTRPHVAPSRLELGYLGGSR